MLHKDLVHTLLYGVEEATGVLTSASHIINSNVNDDEWYLIPRISLILEDCCNGESSCNIYIFLSSLYSPGYTFDFWDFLS